MRLEDLSWGAIVTLGILAGIALRILASEIVDGFMVPVPRPVDPADTAVWDVLAEARRIVDEADGAAG